MATLPKLRLAFALPQVIRNADPGGAALENHARAAYQSAHARDGHVPPLPLTLADALAEAAQLYPNLFGDNNAR